MGFGIASVRKRKKLKGKYRRELNINFDKPKYNKRNIAETTFSVVKRKFGETLRARKYYNQVKEIKIKLIVYNVDKKVIGIICVKLRISTRGYQISSKKSGSNLTIVFLEVSPI